MNEILKSTLYSLMLLLLSSCCLETTLEESLTSQLQMELYEREHREPLKYLELSEELKNDIKKGGWFSSDKVIGQSIVGTITNQAAFAVYKDIKISVVYFSKTKAEVGRDVFTVYDFIKPRAGLKLSQKLSVPPTAESFDATIISAVSSMDELVQ